MFENDAAQDIGAPHAGGAVPFTPELIVAGNPGGWQMMAVGS